MSEQELLNWLVARAAHYTNRPAEAIRPDDKLTTIGLDSLGMVGLSGDIEEHIAARVNPEWMYDHDTLRDLAKFLVNLK